MTKSAALLLVTALLSMTMMGSASGASLPYADAFDRTNGSLGPDWSEVGGHWTISSGQGVPPQIDTISEATLDIGTSSVFAVAASITLSPTFHRANAGLTALFVNHDNHIFCKIEVTDGNPNGLLTIGKRQRGVTTSLLSKVRGSAGGWRLLNGAVYRLSLSRSGNAMRCTVSGGNLSAQQQVTYTLTSSELSSFGSGTRVGMRSKVHFDEDDGGSRYDNFSATS